MYLPCLFTEFVPWDFNDHVSSCLDKSLFCTRTSSSHFRMWFGACSIDLPTTSLHNQTSVSWGICRDGKSWAKGWWLKGQHLQTPGFEKMKAWATAHCSLEILFRNRAPQLWKGRLQSSYVFSASGETVFAPSGFPEDCDSFRYIN